MNRRLTTIALSLAALLHCPALLAEPVDTESMWWTTRLWEYFGLIGHVAVACILLTVGIILLFRQMGPRRSRLYRLALVLAVIGYAFALWNSARVSRMEVDHEYEKALEARKRRELMRKQLEEEARRKWQNDPGYRVQFAEETEADKLDLAGQESEEQKKEKENVYERAAKGELEALRKIEKGRTGKDDESLNPDEVTDAAYEGLANMDEGQKDARYAYRNRGPKKRREGARDDEMDVLTKAEIKQPGNKEGGGSIEDVKLYRMADVDLANKIDNGIRHTARWVLVTMLLLVFWNYLRTFNDAFHFLFPLPVGGPWMDLFRRKQYSVLLNSQSQPVIASYLRKVVRKGESFIYFGEQDPCPGSRLSRFFVNLGRPLNRLFGKISDWLYDPGKPGRIPVQWLQDLLYGISPALARNTGVALTIFVRFLKRVLCRLPFFIFFVALAAIPIPLFFKTRIRALQYFIISLTVLSPLLFIDTPLLRTFVPKMRYDDDNHPKNPEHMFDTAWFGRGCFTVTSRALADAMIRELRGFLAARRASKAAALRPVNIFWDFDDPPDEDLLFELSALCRRTNCRLLVINPNAETTNYAQGVFDAIRTEPMAKLEPIQYGH